MTAPRTSRLARAWIWAWALALTPMFAVALGCEALKPVFASPSDLADYRAFRVAAAEGTRLSRAKAYLDRHPSGAFADEVHAVFDEEEPRYFQRAQASREFARRYLVDLPEGPHAGAAMALLGALASSMHEAELSDIARRSRFDEWKLEAAAVQRRAVGESILGATGVLLDEAVYGVPRTEGSASLARLMMGKTPPTWGAVPSRREDDLFFLLPTRPARESRVLTLEVSLVEKGGIVVASSIEGTDMFVRWAEADQITKLDPAAVEDRTEAHVHAMDRLAGALERRFPSASCPERREGSELYHRACNGWEVAVTPGAQAGAKDTIVLHGPAARERPRTKP